MTGKITFGSAAESHDHKIGYIPQGDLHVSALTVKETLWFAARLQMPENYSKNNF
jgi:ABC-type multidrug transport system ATPase subunit